jgi:hypothetical protein
MSWLFFARVRLAVERANQFIRDSFFAAIAAPSPLVVGALIGGGWTVALYLAPAAPPLYALPVVFAALTAISWAANVAFAFVFSMIGRAIRALVSPTTQSITPLGVVDATQRFAAPSSPALMGAAA